VKKKSEKFIQALINLCREGKPLANLVMAIASYTQAKSIVEYSESPLYHYQYSSIGKLFSALLDSFEGNPAEFATKVQLFIKEYRPFVEILRFQLDTTPVFKPHSPTHEGRQSVYRPNQTIFGNKPIEIGYNLSCLNLGFFPKISIPWSMERVSVQETGIQTGVRQVQTFCTGEKTDCLIVVTADSGYGTAEYLCPLQDCLNLVTITRFKNRKVYEKASAAPTGGAPAVYGNAFALRKPNQSTHYKHPKTGVLVAAQTSIFEKKPTNRTEYYTKSAQKRPFLIQITQYQDLLIRSKKGHSMKKKAFDLVIVEYWDVLTGAPLFNKPIYLAVCGTRKGELLLQDVYAQHYLHRYDIEINNRFMKHQLLMDKFQTPIQAHFDLWLVIIQLVEWLLFLAADELTPQPKKWQKSGELNRIEPIGTTIVEATSFESLAVLAAAATTEVPFIEPTRVTGFQDEFGSEAQEPLRVLQPMESQGSLMPPPSINPPRLSLPQARKAAQNLFLTFDPTNLLPQTSQKGKGRKLGTRFTPKPTFKPVKKTPKSKKKEPVEGNLTPNLRKKQLNSS
jgi:hypothetical protein